MTVCLAALCVAQNDDGTQHPAVVVAADRMVTLGNFIEFEHAVPKMAEPSSTTVALIAGDTLTGTDMARSVANDFSGQSPRSEDIANALLQKYILTRNDHLSTAILQPRAMTLQDFYGSHASLNGQIVMMIDQQMQQFNLGVELLLAGIDVDGGHLYSIVNPGQTAVHDVIGYVSTGSGAIHAMQSMIGFGHHAGAPLAETVFRVYASKRRAEVAPGVGHDTDLLVISGSGITHLDEPDLKTLSEAFDTHEDAMKTALGEKLGALDLHLGED